MSETWTAAVRAITAANGAAFLTDADGRRVYAVTSVPLYAVWSHPQALMTQDAALLFSAAGDQLDAEGSTQWHPAGG